MGCEVCLFSIFFFGFLWTARFCLALTKCCPLQYELSLVNVTQYTQNTSRLNVDCVKSAGNTLAVTRPVNLTIGLPNCSQFRLIEVYDKSSRVDCIDRVRQRSTIFGIRCDDEPTTTYPTFTIPFIVNFRKCCPPNRKYDPEKQFCWNHLAENYTNALSDVLKLVVREKNAIVNVSYGNPPCRPTDALVDRLDYYQKIRLTPSEGVYDGNGLLLSFDEYCLDVVDDLFEHIIVRSCQDQHTVCGSSEICFRKCCPVGYEVKKKSCQPSTKALSLAFHNDSQALADIRPAVLQGDRCKDGKYKVPKDDAKKYVLTVDGQIYIPSANIVMGMNDYCFDTIDQQIGTHMFICFAEEWQHPKLRFQFRLTLTMTCASISAIFLLLTLIIYAILPSLKNAHCRLIMCYLFTSMISYIVVVVQGMLPRLLDVSSTLCKILGYSMLFTFLSSFSWLNIISFDIWSTFRAVESSFFKKAKTSKRFFLFGLYGWGFAAGWTALAVFCQLTTSADIPPILKPDIGQLSCWFSNYGYSRIPFFIVPVSAMVTFNIVLFIVTVKYCAQIKFELQRSHGNNDNNYSIKKYTADMNEFMINIKLFILMGLNWTMELISLTVEPENRIFFLVSDIVNGLEGIIIFCLFVLKRKVLRDLRKTFFGEYHAQHTRDRAATFTTSTSSSVLQSMIKPRGVNKIP